MTVFANYARYYDLLYRDKDYEGEADYIAGLVNRHAPGTETVLELGSGTGRHAELLAGKGLRLTGIDRSPTMLDQARARAAAFEGEGGMEFMEGDICDFFLDRHFDVVISLFHVVSYVTGTGALAALFGCVRRHLKPGGVFIFDCWYGPAVLTQRPEVRVLRLEDDAIDVTRLAEPVLHANDNVVDVNYEILVREKATDAVERHRETHHMRYLFKPELDALLSEAGMSVAHCEEWMTGREPGTDTWGVCVVAKG